MDDARTKGVTTGPGEAQKRPDRSAMDPRTDARDDMDSTRSGPHEDHKKARGNIRDPDPNKPDPEGIPRADYS
jgi:hypothetical protein